MPSYTPGLLHRRGFERSISVVEALDPAVGREFVRTTAVAMRDALASSDEETAWAGGLLNGTGAPLEFSFATFADDLRYTVEVGVPAESPEERLAHIESVLDEIDPCGGHRELVRQFHQVQKGSGLQWGAWLGIRHRRKDATTSFKIYAEIPPQSGPAASKLVSEYLGGAADSCHPSAPLLLIGKSPNSDRCEFYFEFPGSRLDLRDLDCLLARVGLGERREDLVELIRSFVFKAESSGADALPDCPYGFSYSVLPGRREPVFSIFAFAAALTGGDGLVRRQVLLATRRRGWDLGGYASLTEPVVDRFFRSTYHNMISFQVGEGPRSGLQISVSPPPLGLDDGR
jgi:hypothetical protein